MLPVRDIFDGSAQLAVYLLTQARIGPHNNDPDQDEFDQYRIDRFDIDVDKIEIVNWGVLHTLKAVKL